MATFGDLSVHNQVGPVIVPLIETVDPTLVDERVVVADARFELTRRAMQTRGAVRSLVFLIYLVYHLWGLRRDQVFIGGLLGDGPLRSRYVLGEWSRHNFLIYMIKSRYEFICWDARFTVPLLEFQFQFVLPKLQKERFIVIRDTLGRNVRSVVPASGVVYNKSV